MATPTVQINRAPVLALWGAVVAERMGHDASAALTLGKCMAGLNAQRKGRSLGIFGPPTTDAGGEPAKAGLGEELWIDVCGRSVPATDTPDGIRAVVKDKPIDPQKVRTYLASKFGDDLDAVRSAMRDLASSMTAEDLAGRAYGLYEQFRPQIPKGRRGWGAKGELNLSVIRLLAEKHS